MIILREPSSPSLPSEAGDSVFVACTVSHNISMIQSVATMIRISMTKTSRVLLSNAHKSLGIAWIVYENHHLEVCPLEPAVSTLVACTVSHKISMLQRVATMMRMSIRKSTPVLLSNPHKILGIAWIVSENELSQVGIIFFVKKWYLDPVPGNTFKQWLATATFVGRCHFSRRDPTSSLEFLTTLLSLLFGSRILSKRM